MKIQPNNQSGNRFGKRSGKDRNSDGLKLAEANLSPKVFQAALKKFQNLEPINTLWHYMKSLCALCLLCLSSFSFASEDGGTIPRIIAAPAEPLDIVLLCPEGSQHEGELVPKWVTNDEATEFFCNDSVEETEAGK